MKTVAHQIAERIHQAGQDLAPAFGIVPFADWDTYPENMRALTIAATEQVLVQPLNTTPPENPGARRFVLRRYEDETGMSGIGDVAEGVVFNDGTAAMRWSTDLASTAVYGSIDDVTTIHGHGGRTRVVFIDQPDGVTPPA